MTEFKLGWNPFFENQIPNFARFPGEPARVVAEHRTCYVVRAQRGEMRATLAGRLRHSARDDPAARPAVGDWVIAEPEAVGAHDADSSDVEPWPSSADDLEGGGGHAVIHAVFDRQSCFKRAAAGGTTQAQVVAANVDHLFIVMALDADFNLRRLERTLALAHESGARPVVLLTKKDLCPDVASRCEAARSVALDAPVHAISVLEDGSLDCLEPYLKEGVTVALMGMSGVGKSSLVNALAGARLQETQDTRAWDGRGRHTTTARHLLRTSSGAWVLDTPGMRELRVWHGEDGMTSAFSDIDALSVACRFRDCAHQAEPGCAVQAAVAQGLLPSERLRSYEKLKREIRHFESKHDARMRSDAKKQWREITMHQRRMKKEKGRP